MGLSEFKLEYYSAVALPHDDVLRQEADARLRALIDGHDDIIDASVSINELTDSETPYCYRVRVFVFMRPENVVAVEKAEDALAALQAALDAVERQVREQRTKLREQHRRG